MSEKQEITILKNARKLIEKKEDWFGGDNPAKYSECGYADDRLCLGYAIIRATTKLGLKDISGNVWSNTTKMLGLPNNVLVTSFNDTHTHEEVLALVDKALENG